MARNDPESGNAGSDAGLRPYHELDARVDVVNLARVFF